MDDFGPLRYHRKNMELLGETRKPRHSGRRIFRALACGLLLGCAVAGCRSAQPPPPTPEATVMRFSRALNQGQLKEAYGLMSREYRQRVSFERFEQQLKENPEETIEMGNALGRVHGEAEQQAVLRYGDDQEMRLERESGGWAIATPVVDFYDQSNPRAALRSFVRAMERKRYDVVMRLVPDADKEGITTERMAEAWSGDGREEVERMLESLRNHMEAPIEVTGNRATMPYGDRTRVQFVREDGVWKIEDPE
ncbi:MAG: hypothetical protein PVI30_24465 [Myxococcales bacterium]|jgi:hypothetical protein